MQFDCAEPVKQLAFRRTLVFSPYKRMFNVRVEYGSIRHLILLFRRADASCVPTYILRHTKKQQRNRIISDSIFCVSPISIHTFSFCLSAKN